MSVLKILPDPRHMPITDTFILGVFEKNGLFMHAHIFQMIQDMKKVKLFIRFKFEKLQNDWSHDRVIS